MPDRNVNLLVVHHTASPAGRTVADIRRGHIARGFSDIGYHAVIYSNGHLYRGRPENRSGAHAGGANVGSLGVTMVGNFEEMEPAIQQLTTLKYLLTNWCQKYDLTPEAIKGHRDVGTTPTRCPGTNLYKHLPGIRKAVRLLIPVRIAVGFRTEN